MRSRPEVTVHYKPAIVRPGDELTVDLDMVSHGSTPVSRIAITLTGRETIVQGGESSSSTTLVSLVAEFPATTLGTGTHTRSAVFQIPKKAPPTVRAAGVVPQQDLATEYEIAVEVEIPWWPDLRRVFVLVIDPALPPAAPVPSRRFAEVLSRADGEALAFEVWLDSTALRRGEALSGHLLFPRFPDDERVDVQVTFVASARRDELEVTSPHDFARYESPVLTKAPSSGSPVDFEVVLPVEVPPSYKGFVMKIAWRAEIAVRRRRGKVTYASPSAVRTFPIEVFGGEGGSGVSGGLKAEIAHLGAERRHHLWTQVAETLGLVHDQEADRLRWSAGEVKAEILVEDGPTGTFTVAQLAWPALGVGLRVGPRRLSDVLRGGVETDDAAFDRLYRVEARERSQAMAVLGQEVRRALARFAEGGVTLDDEGARLVVGGNGRDEQALVQLAARAKTLAEELAKGFARVPMPAVLARGEAAWRGVAERLGGLFAPGSPWIREGKWNEATVEMGIVWDGGVVRGTVLRMVLDPPLGGAVSPRAPDARMSRPALARMNALADKVGRAVFGPSVVEVTLEAATLDPETALPMFEEMAAVAAALQGRLEGPYR